MHNLAFTRAGGTGTKTAAAGTAITELIRPVRGLIGRLTRLLYTPGATGHTLTAQRELSRGITPVEAASGQAVVRFKSDPGTGTAAGAIAAGDVVVFERNDRSHLVAIVQSVAAVDVDGFLPVTFTANLTAILKKGANFWFLGAIADGHPQYTLATGAQRTLEDANLGFVGADREFSPVLLTINNITNAGVLDYASYGWYVDNGLTGTAAAPAPEGAEAAADDEYLPRDGEETAEGLVIFPASAVEGVTPGGAPEQPQKAAKKQPAKAGKK